MARFRLMLPLLLVSCWLSLPSQASATQVNWNCGVQSVGTWCLYDVRHTYYESKAHYPGNSVCTKVILDSNGSTYASACGTSTISQTFCACYLTKPLSYNGGPNAHTIFGNAWY